jgi:hypothetical protein
MLPPQHPLATRQFSMMFMALEVRLLVSMIADVGG